MHIEGREKIKQEFDIINVIKSLQDVKILIQNQKQMNSHFMYQINRSNANIILIDKDKQDEANDGDSENFEHILEQSEQSASNNNSDSTAMKDQRRQEAQRALAFKQMQNDILEERDFKVEGYQSSGNEAGYGSGYNSDHTLTYDDRIQIEEEKKQGDFGAGFDAFNGNTR